MRYLIFILFLTACSKSMPVVPPPVPHNLLIIENKSGSGVTLSCLYVNGWPLIDCHYGSLPEGQTFVDSNYHTDKNFYEDGSRYLTFYYSGGPSKIVWPGGTLQIPVPTKALVTHVNLLGDLVTDSVASGGYFSVTLPLDTTVYRIVISP